MSLTKQKKINPTKYRKEHENTEREKKNMLELVFDCLQMNVNCLQNHRLVSQPIQPNKMPENSLLSAQNIYKYISLAEIAKGLYRKSSYLRSISPKHNHTYTHTHIHAYIIFYIRYNVNVYFTCFAKFCFFFLYFFFFAHSM